MDNVEFWKELGKKLTPGLAFAVIMYAITAIYGDQIPEKYQFIPYILIIGGFLVYTILRVVQVRNNTPTTEHHKVDVDRDVRESIINTGSKNHINQIINNFSISHPDTDKKELRSQIHGYLAWMEETFGRITLRGIEQGGRQVVELPLDTVYVPLQAEYSTNKDDEPLQSQDPRDTEERNQKIELDQILDLGPRLIITGGPGCGKSTVLQHIAWTLAHAIQQEKTSLAREKLGLGFPLPLPIYVPLSLYATHLRNLPKNATGEKKTLAAFIADYLLQNQTSLNLDSAFFAELLRDEKHVLLLLDGLDEVPDESERVIVRRDIENLVSGKNNLRVVVTSRSAAYQGRAVLGHDFQQIQVLPIAEEQIRSMVTQAYRAIFPKAPAQAQVKADDLLSGITRLEEERRERLGDDARALVSTPLMVRLLLIVHFNNRRLPDQRADLYQKAVDAMLRPDYTVEEAVAEEIEHRVGGSLPMNREILQLLAFHMHQRGESQGREIDENRLREILCNDPTYESYVDELIAQTCQRGTLLEERGGLYRFIHLSFQEYLTGRYLVERMRDLNKIAAFLEKGPIQEAWWREPILLMIGYLDITSPKLAEEMIVRLAGLDEDSKAIVETLSLETQLASAELATIAYQECETHSSILQNNLETRLLVFLERDTQESMSFSPPILASVADSLDRFGYQPPDLHTFVPIPTPQSPEFYIARYPVTNIQYQRFLEADDFAEKQYWMDFPKFSEPDKEIGEIQILGNWGSTGWDWLQDALKDKDISPDGKAILPLYWDDPRFGIARAGVPLVGITWYEANAYCKWLLVHWDEQPEAGQNPGWRPELVRLPTETEWIASAGGNKPENRFPWDRDGEITEEEAEILKRANVGGSGIGRTTPVGMYPLGASPHGVWDLGGNVWEWQANYFGLKLADEEMLALRGGSWYNLHNRARLSYRDYIHPVDRWYCYGFRVAAFPNGRS